MLLDAVKDLKNSSKELFNLVDSITKDEVKAFSKSLDKFSKVLSAHKISKEALEDKKRFVTICNLNIESSTGCALTYKEMGDMLSLKEDDIEEWAITAINNDIIDARID